MDSSAALDPNKASHGRQAACLNCRKSKIRCNRGQDDASCSRCKQANVECIIPSHHVGRQKGVKNKRKGLEKALHQIEQAIKRPRSDASGSEAAQKLISDLQEMLSNTREPQLHSEADDQSEDFDRSYTYHSPRDNIDDNLSLDDAENPLQLLARASDLQLSPTEVRGAHKWPPSTIQPSGMLQNSTEGSDPAAQSYFVPIRASLDVGPDIDPIDIGLVTPSEAESLFSFFYQNLAHTRWGLDPLVHTVSFVRTQSAFLFTSIMAAAALFLPSATALSKRLSRHCKTLAQNVIVRRHRSVEIVLAFMVNVPWMEPGSCLGDDDTCSYIAMALAVALDLSLNKIVLPSSSFEPSLLRRLAKAETIDAKRALYMDRFDGVEPTSAWGRRLLRRRERTWIALFVLERGVCLARGRSYTVPSTALINHCDKWHVSDSADSRDGPMNSMAVLRRNLDGLFLRVKANCDSHQVTDAGSEVAQSIKNMIESFYDQWYEIWAPEIGEGHSRSLPPYVEILVTHTRLSTYGGVINHPTAPVEVKRFFRAAGLSSALNVLRAAIQGEARLKSMPNNTVIMISFAACSALSLSVMPEDSRSSLAPSVHNLIEETAGVLERIGATTRHRNGASVLYGRFLRALVRRAPVSAGSQNGPRGLVETGALQPPPDLDGYCPVASGTQPSSIPSPFIWPEPLRFSAMSDDQIIDAVNRAGTAFGTTVPDVPLDDLMTWDWFDVGNAADFGF
ncbi:Zn(II)2Cys6 transcription factor [Aspergillus eucalypticola CBS 122712]|uniref:Zn(II)2Cys6 transcription factor n=1 Tax=Aspergillus eucalypticola (strain CBS 122712 / IBT 29274) TaxID=1448314 RepID=A0A317WGN2_ASPEC|nr:Zn(II)2Cys6 transcription factor [Aspergillus eucalypticola CBS 122712]PWY85624.1 Zn(II)2Cys6 transcription factor [Aspergillus eucalypticola CBS 122712]